jgi:transcriptional regulator
MYLPSHFRQQDPAELRALIEASPLAVLVTFGDGRLHVSHIPLLFDAASGPHGTLIGHFAAANPQSQHYDASVEAIAIFNGPDAYVSPNWYETKRETAKVVPTWNYVAVYAYGEIAFIDDAVGKRAVVARLTGHHEAKQPKPWAVDDAPEDFVQAQLRAIRPFEFRIARLEGKWKLSQNRTEQDRSSVIAALGSDDAPKAQDSAARMRRLYGCD